MRVQRVRLQCCAIKQVRGLNFGVAMHMSMSLRILRVTNYAHIHTNTETHHTHQHELVHAQSTVLMHIWKKLYYNMFPYVLLVQIC